MRVLILIAGLMLLPGAAALEEIEHPDPSDYSGLVRTILEKARERFETRREESSLDGEDYGQLGMAYQANSLYVPARQAFLNAMEVAPHDSRWPYYLALIAHDQGDFERAEELYRSSLELNPDYVPAKIRLAVSLIEQGRNGEARELLEPVVAEYPDQAAVRAELARAQLQLGEFEAAAENLEHALELQPQASRLHYQLGVALRAQGKTEEAAGHFERAGDVMPTLSDPLDNAMRRLSGSATYYSSLAYKALAAGDAQAALQLFGTAIEAGPENVYPFISLALLLIELDRADESEAVLDRAREQHPEEPFVFYAYGLLYASTGRDEKAVESFRRAFDINPDMIEAVQQAAHANQRLGRHAEAAELYERALELEPNNLQFPLYRAAAQERAGSCRDALDTMVMTIMIAPENVDILLAYARLAATCPEATKEERENALNASRNLYVLSPNLATISTLAVVEANRGNREEAEELLIQGLFQARRDGQLQHVPTLERLLEAVRDQRALQRPWFDEHALLNPPRPEPQLLGQGGAVGKG